MSLDPSANRSPTSRCTSHRTDGPSPASSGSNGSAGLSEATPAAATPAGYRTPVSRGQRSPACTATDSEPADDRNSGTPATAAASTALAPATAASTPGRRSINPGARRHGGEDSVASGRARPERTGRIVRDPDRDARGWPGYARSR